MDSVKLTIQLTEEYRVRMEKAKAAEDLRKCRSWIDLLGAVDSMAEVEIDKNGITLRCRDQKGPVQESCGYDSVLALTERKDGILMRLSHKRLLFLPATDDGAHNELVMHAMLLLSTHCRYLFRAGRLRLPGVSFADKLRYHTRPRQGHDTSDHFIKGAMVALLCASLLVGTVFTTQPIRNRKIEREEALVVSGTFAQAHPVSNKGVLKYIDLEFADAEEQTIDGCCVGQGLEDKLAQFPSGTKLRLLVHPQSQYVLQMEADGVILLEFDDAQEYLWREAIGFMWIGLNLYGAAVILTVIMVRKKR